MDKPVQFDYKEQILALPIATEWAKKENIVIVYDDYGKGWMRGKGNSRYRVMPIYSDNPSSFTMLKSGRS